MDDATGAKFCVCRSCVDSGPGAQLSTGHSVPGKYVQPHVYKRHQKIQRQQEIQAQAEEEKRQEAQSMEIQRRVLETTATRPPSSGSLPVRFRDLAPIQSNTQSDVISDGDPQSKVGQSVHLFHLAAHILV